MPAGRAITKGHGIHDVHARTSRSLVLVREQVGIPAHLVRRRATTAAAQQQEGKPDYGQGFRGCVVHHWLDHSLENDMLP